MREANEEFSQLNNELNNIAGPTPNRPNNPNIPARSQPTESAPAAFPDNKIGPPKVEDEPKPNEDDQESNA
jgi:hypothetical protein